MKTLCKGNKPDIKDIYFMIPLMRYQNRQIHRDRKNRLYQGLKERRKRGILFDGYKVSVQDNENILEMCNIINTLN